MNAKRWFFGLVAAFITGGAGAITATQTAASLAPESFNLTGKLHNYLVLLSITFLLNGIFGAMAYLKQSPVPQDVLVDTNTKANAASAGSAIGDGK